MDTKRRILIIENAVDVTGSVTSIVRSSRYLNPAFDFIFILPTKSKAEAFISSNGFSVYTLPMREIRKSGVSIVTYLPALLVNTFRLRRFIAKHNPDLVVNNDFYNLLPAIYRLIGGKVPYLCYVRFLPAKFPPLLVSLWFGLHRRYAEGIIAVSNAVKSQLPKTEKLHVIGNELPDRYVSFRQPESRLILYPSNFIQGKGHEVALASFEKVGLKFPSWKLRFIGGDMGLEKNALFKRSLMARARTSKVSQQIEWHSFADLTPYYYDAAFVLNFSESESFSMTCLEAMFHGRTVIATRCGGPEEIIENGVDGILVDVNDVTAMTSAMEFLIQHPQDNSLMAKRAYDNVRNKFSAARTIEKLGQLYERSFLK